MLPSANELSYFVEVTKTLNLSRAAARLGVTQPALTQAMSKLEGHVGSKLLVRTRRGVEVTRAGEHVAAQATRLLEAWESVKTAARAEETEIGGRYRIGCHPSVGAYVLPPFLRQLAAIAPGIEIHVSHDLSRRVTEAIIDGHVDLGFVVNPFRYPELVMKKLGTDVVAIFEAERGRYGADLFGDPNLMQTQAIVKKLGANEPTIRRFVPCPSLEVVRAVVASGAGFGILPSRVARVRETPRLRRVERDGPTVNDTIWLVYREGALTSRAGKALIRASSRVLA